eukprot:4916478-Pleurochrysis_carterae.AAC.6
MAEEHRSAVDEELATCRLERLRDRTGREGEIIGEAIGQDLEVGKGERDGGRERERKGEGALGKERVHWELAETMVAAIDEWVQRLEITLFDAIGMEAIESAAASGDGRHAALALACALACVLSCVLCTAV